MGIISVTSNIESRYTQVKDMGLSLLVLPFYYYFGRIVTMVMISQGITLSDRGMKQQTEQIAEGNYTVEVMIYGDDELGELGQTINDLSVKNQEAQEGTEAERQRLDSVLRVI